MARKCRATLKVLGHEKNGDEIEMIYLHENFSSIQVSRGVYDRLLDFCETQSCSFVFRKACYALIPDLEVWASLKGQEILTKYSEEVAACFGIFINNYFRTLLYLTNNYNYFYVSFC